MVSGGQLLFKQTANLWKANGAHLGPAAAAVGFSALTLYGAATLLWIFLLRSIPLSRAYPYLALSFLLVPLASRWLFDERITPGMFVGLVLVAVGVVCATRFG